MEAGNCLMLSIPLPSSQNRGRKFPAPEPEELLGARALVTGVVGTERPSPGTGRGLGLGAAAGGGCVYREEQVLQLVRTRREAGRRMRLGPGARCRSSPPPQPRPPRLPGVRPPPPVSG